MSGGELCGAGILLRCGGFLFTFIGFSAIMGFSCFCFTRYGFRILVPFRKQTGMAIDPVVGLTPTENLVLELLIARRRLGERIWTFDSTVRKQVESLAVKGYVGELHGIVPMTVRAMLTDEAIAMFLTYDYVPPIAAGNPELSAVFKTVTEEAEQIKRRLEN